MFGKVIYYDEKAIFDCMSIITGEKCVKINKYEVENDKGVGVDIKVASANAKANKKYTAKIIESMLLDCDKFEKMLTGRDDYFDYTQSDNYDIDTVEVRSIIKIDAYLEIPEGFDMMKIIDQYKSELMNALDDGSRDESGMMALKSVLEKANTKKIPLIVEANDSPLCAKITQDYLISSYEDLEEYNDEQVVVLARIASGKKEASKPFYDPLKDYLSLNRMLRRSINKKESDEVFQPLTVDQPYRQIDVLAIYQ